MEQQLETPMAVRCDTCRFFDAFGSTSRGVCRRYAPRAYTSNSDGRTETWWPFTHGDEWCGEWEQQPTQRVLPGL